MGKIVAIGGGEFKNLETLSIEKEIIALTNKKHPKVLYIPTAGNDSEEWWHIFQSVYKDILHCSVDVLWLIKEKPSFEEIKEKILSADIIWVGGGNTFTMMQIWRKCGVDTLLHKAYKKDIVLAGISAGSICWFSYGHSDSRKYMAHKDKSLIRIKGLGLIRAIYSPHYHVDKKEQDFEKIISKYKDIGIALDNNAALEVVDDQYRLITSKEGAKGYKIWKSNGKVITQELSPTYDSLANLLKI